ncbi:MAG: hypothetical protein PHN35_03085 [Clostridia bacterium]|nr:hypothetical protein [Clostridia bacterium]
MKKFLIILLICFVLAMAFLPQPTFNAAERGFYLWLEVVLPALLPFFICSELLLSLGAMDDLGKALNGLMRPLFNLPGAASLAIVMGYTSGFPTGAAVCASLRTQGLISKSEGDRLLAFTNNAGPLFILISIATGILQTPQAGPLILIVHYGLNLILGIILGRSAPTSSCQPSPKRPPQQTIPGNQPIGRLLKTAAKKSGVNIAIIGCYMIFFSVAAELAAHCLHLPSIICGAFLEMTLGVNAVSETGLSLPMQIALAGAIISFGGLCVQSQVAAMVADTDLSVKTYLLCRLFHSAATFIVLYLLSAKLSLTACTAAFTPPLMAIIMYNWVLALAISLLIAIASLLSRYASP